MAPDSDTSHQSFDVELTFPTLNYVTRLLAFETNLERIVDISLETLADFGRCSRVEILSFDTGQESAVVMGIIKDGKISRNPEEVTIKGTPLSQIVKTKRPGTYKTKTGIERLCLPLIGKENNVNGLVITDLPVNEPVHPLETQLMIILTTMISISVERSRYFQMAMFDGLTGLYVRRQFDLRLREEMARVKRHGGSLSLAIVDIDHFKRVNDTYGHQQGDIVLKELADIMRETIRTDVDIPCRYGGEELIIILPSTDLEDAYDVAERFRINCEEHDFSGQVEPLKVTVSGGVAGINQEDSITPENFLERADSKLFEAKESGRNQIIAWK